MKGEDRRGRRVKDHILFESDLELHKGVCVLIIIDNGQSFNQKEWTTC